MLKEFKAVAPEIFGSDRYAVNVYCCIRQVNQTIRELRITETLYSLPGEHAVVSDADELVLQTCEVRIARVLFLDVLLEASFKQH